MKKNILIFAIILASLTSCSDWLDINNDPSLPQVAPAEVLLPPVFQEMLRGELFDSRYFGAYVQNWQHTTANRAEDLHGFFSGSDALGEKWRQHYWAIGENIDLIIEDGIKNEKWWYAGVGYAIRAWSWQTSTDVYGEMILKQAWEPNRYVFDYDSQDLIYAEVVRLCGLALDYLNKEDITQTLKNGDLAFAGDRDKWKKFVYAILARNANHISNKAGYNADEVIEFVDQAMTANSDNFYVPHLGVISDNANFLGPLRSNLGVYRQSAFSIRLLDGTVYGGVVDPRLSLMFWPSTDGVYRGLTPGGGNTFSGTQAIPTLYNKYIYKNDAPVPLFTFAEMQFIKAEAAFKKGDKATAYAAYINGIKAHMEYTGVSNTDRDIYLASAAVAVDANALTISMIMVQKYIAMYGHGILETWVDMRRYDYDSNTYPTFALPNPLAATNNGAAAFRARPRYNSEYVWNIEALDAIGARALDYHTKKPWYLIP